MSGASRVGGDAGRPKRVLGYARVSSAEQALGTSLADQQRVIEAHATKGGLKVHRMFVEAEGGGREKAERRVQLMTLMSDVRSGDLVLVDKLDRWSRDPEFIYKSTREIRERGASFYAVHEGLDPSTPNGEIHLGIMATMARAEHTRIRTRTVGTRKLLRRAGYYVEGLPPFGYRRQDVKGAERNALVVDEARAVKVRAVFRMSIEGHTLESIGARLGLRNDRVRWIIRARAYLGEVLIDGLWTPGKVPTLIDPATFLAANEALSARRMGTRSSKDESALTVTWWLRDIAKCAYCGSHMTSAYGPIPKRGDRKVYFKCGRRCGASMVRVDVAEREADPLVAERLVQLRDELANPPLREVVASVDTKAERSRLDKKRARLLEAFTDGHMDRDELRTAMGKLDAERTRLDALDASAPAPSTGQRAEALRSVEGIRRLWTRAQPAERRVVIRGLAKACRLASDRAPSFDWFNSAEIAGR